MLQAVTSHIFTLTCWWFWTQIEVHTGDDRGQYCPGQIGKLTKLLQLHTYILNFWPNSELYVWNDNWHDKKDRIHNRLLQNLDCQDNRDRSYVFYAAKSELFTKKFSQWGCVVFNLFSSAYNNVSKH